MSSTLRERLKARYAPARKAAGIVEVEPYRNPFIVHVEPEPKDPYFEPMVAHVTKRIRRWQAILAVARLPSLTERASAAEMRAGRWAMDYAVDERGRLR